MKRLGFAVLVAAVLFCCGNATVMNCSTVPAVGGTAWEQYLHDVCSGYKLQPICYPTMYPAADPATAKGLVVYFHGYSACPSSSAGYSQYISENFNMYVYTFLFPGHGRVYNDCVVASECSNGYPTESLPTSRQGYIDLVKQAVSVTQSEVTRLGLKGKTIAVSGLSHGGAAATYAMAIAPGLFTHKLIMNGFFGISNIEVDDIQEQCLPLGVEQDQCILNALNASIHLLGDLNDTAEEVAKDLTNAAAQAFLAQASELEMDFYEKWAVVMNILRNELSLLIENRNMIPANLTWFFDLDGGWPGNGCTIAMETAGRGGMCNFKMKHILAAHSFASYALAQSRISKGTGVNVQFMTVQRDGPTRTSLEWQAAQAEARNGAVVHMCMFRVKDGCTEVDDNICGVPHSMLDPSDNILLAPYELYWEPYLIQNAADFLGHWQTSVGVAAFNGSNNGECEVQDVISPNMDLVGYIIHGGLLQLQQDSLVATGAIDLLIFLSIVQQLNVPEWAVIMTRLEDPSGSGANDFLLELPQYLNKQLVAGIAAGNITSFAGVHVVSYTPEADNFSLPTFQPTTSPTYAPTAAPTAAPTTESICPNALYSQCAGQGYVGATCCPANSACHYQDQWFSQCVPATGSPNCAAVYTQCGGIGWTGSGCCAEGSSCQQVSLWYAQCVPSAIL